MKKQWLKRTAAVLMLSCGVASVAPQKAQGIIVEDILNYTESKLQWAQRKLEEYEKLGILMEQLAQATALFQQGEVLYNHITTYVKNGKQYWELYAAGKRLYYDIDLVKNYLEFMRLPSGPDFSTVSSSIQTTASTALDYYYELQRLIRFTLLIIEDMNMLIDDANTILKGNNNMTNADNIGQIANKAEQLNDHAESIEKEILDIMRRQYNDSKAFGVMLTLEQATAAVKTMTTKETISINDDQLARSVISNDDKEYDVTSEIHNSTYGEVINLVCVIIGIMAMFMIAWGYYRATKGERQHLDALWKVFAGIIFIILLLQVIKTAVIPTFIH